MNIEDIGYHALLVLFSLVPRKYGTRISPKLRYPSTGEEVVTFQTVMRTLISRSLKVFETRVLRRKFGPKRGK
jgi:hypothetical protein